MCVCERERERARESERERERERESEKEQAIACKVIGAIGGCEARGLGAHPRVVRIVRRERAEQSRRLPRPERAPSHARALSGGVGVSTEGVYSRDMGRGKSREGGVECTVGTWVGARVGRGGLSVQ